jgi:hypothetical protein
MPNYVFDENFNGINIMKLCVDVAKKAKVLIVQRIEIRIEIVLVVKSNLSKIDGLIDKLFVVHTTVQI